MTYPPQFDENLLYPRVLNLDEIDVYHEDDSSSPHFFTVGNIPTSIGYGKHYFTVSYKDPPIIPIKLRNNTEILIEAKDANGTVIFTDNTPIANISGETISYLWVKRDPLRTYNDIVDGIGTLTIVGELEGVPPEWVDKYNIRLTLPLNIRKETPNTSPILIQSKSLIESALTISETVQADIGNANFNRSYANITFDNLDTYGGKIDKIEVSYLESGSALSSSVSHSEYTMLDTYNITSTGSLGKTGSFEYNIDEDYAQGLNPKSFFRQVIVPPIPHQQGTTFDGDPVKLQFRFKFLNSEGQYAQEITDSGSAAFELTSSFIEFDGPATVIQGDNNLIDGQVYIGNAIGTGIEVNASSSAYLRSIGYLGFDSASAGTGAPGFVIYTGSILGANTDEYSDGGVGLELVQDSNNYLKFNTKKSELDIHTSKFFIGGSGQFVSGANNNIEISSSGFHLQNNGNVIVSGTISASHGNIAGWTIGQNSLQAASMSLNALSSSIFKVNSGSAVTPDAGNDQRFFIDFTPLDQTTSTKYYVRFGPNFGVTSEGTLIASGAQIEGVLIADDGTIGGFSILTQSLYGQPSEDAFIGMSTAGDTAFFASASLIKNSGSAAFNVKFDGTMTASKARIDGTSILATTEIFELADATASLQEASNSFSTSIDLNSKASSSLSIASGSYSSSLVKLDEASSSFSSSIDLNSKASSSLSIASGSYSSSLVKLDEASASYSGSLVKLDEASSSLSIASSSYSSSLVKLDIMSESFSSSFHNLNVASNSYSSSIDANSKASSSLSAASASYSSSLVKLSEASASYSSSIVVLTVMSESFSSSFHNLNVASNSFSSSIDTNSKASSSLSLASSSFSGSIRNLDIASSSFSSSIDTNSKASSSLSLASSSFSGSIRNLDIASSSFSSSIDTNSKASSSLSLASSSFSGSIRDLDIASSSFSSSIDTNSKASSSLSLASSSFSGSIRDLDIASSSFSSSIDDNSKASSSLSLASSSFSGSIRNLDIASSSFSSSIDSNSKASSSLSLASSSFSGSIRNLDIASSSFSSSIDDNSKASSSLSLASSSFSGSIRDLDIASSSFSGSIRDLDIASSSFSSSIDSNSKASSSLSLASSSFSGSIRDLDIASSSFSSSIDSNSKASSSLSLASGSYALDSASYSTRHEAAETTTTLVNNSKDDWDEAYDASASFAIASSSFSSSIDNNSKASSSLSLASSSFSGSIRDLDIAS